MFNDPITGKQLICNCQTKAGEVYRANEEKIVASVMRVYNCDKTEAIRLINNSDEEHFLIVDGEEVWCE